MLAHRAGRWCGARTCSDVFFHHLGDLTLGTRVRTDALTAAAAAVTAHRGWKRQQEREPERDEADDKSESASEKSELS